MQTLPRSFQCNKMCRENLNTLCPEDNILSMYSAKLKKMFPWLVESS